jgi:hypothetical protein
MQVFKTIVSILLIIAGILSIVFGIVVLNKFEGSYGSYAIFGGDFYTYINDNANRTADNTRYNNEIVKAGFGFILIISGLTIILVSIRSMLNDYSMPYKGGSIIYSIQDNGNGKAAPKKDDMPELAEEESKEKSIPNTQNSDVKSEPKEEIKIIEPIKTKPAMHQCKRCGYNSNITPCPFCFGMSDEVLENSRKLNPVKPNKSEEEFVLCPSCGKRQNASRAACYCCGQPFLTDEI